MRLQLLLCVLLHAFGRICNGLRIGWHAAQLDGLLVAFAFRLDGAPDVLQFAGQIAVAEDFGGSR